MVATPYIFRSGVGAMIVRLDFLSLSMRFASSPHPRRYEQIDAEV